MRQRCQAKKGREKGGLGERKVPGAYQEKKHKIAKGGGGGKDRDVRTYEEKKKKGVPRKGRRPP